MTCLVGSDWLNGETVWHNGPVVEAMERGAVLLLDEVDLSSNKIMCLQSVLEGKGVYLKKVNRWVHACCWVHCHRNCQHSWQG